MPYLVQVIEDNDGDGGQAQLNTLESEGWTLVQVVQAFTEHQWNAQAQRYDMYDSPAQYVLHKPVEKKPGKFQAF